VLQQDAAVIAATLQAQQVQSHHDNVPWATTGALLLGLLFLGVQWHAIGHGALLAWATALLLAQGWRAGLWLWRRRGGGPRGGDAAWLRLYRANFGAHGAVWAAASFLPMPADQPLQLALLVILLAGICASNFVLNAFDLAAALLFGVPTMAALALRLALGPDGGLPPVAGIGVPVLMGGAVLLALGFFALVGRRAHRMVRENTLLRLADARQNHLLRVLIGTTSEGFWFIDNQGRTVDANPAMCRMLGRPLAAVVGRSIYDFVDAANRAVFEQELARRAQGLGGGYEITLLRPDGSMLDCWNQATPIHDERGVRIGSVGLWTDISERKRAERALRETSEALRQKSQVLEETLASLGQGVLHCDADGRLLAWNQRMVELLELPASLFHAETRHADLSRFLIARGDLQPNQELFDESGQRMPVPGTPGHLPDLYVRRTPSGLLLEVRTRRLPDGGMVRTFADVTAYLQALRGLGEREQAQRVLLEALPGHIIVTDEQHRYTYVNQRFAALIGQPREALIGRHAGDVIGAARWPQVLAKIDEARRAGPVISESDYPATAWRPRVRLQVTHAVGHDPATGQERVFAFGIDVTAAKAAEEALVAARDEAERANRAKSQFLSSMSHELRTPLNAILGFGHLLATDTRHPLAPGQQQQMAEILNGARHLLQLINELLDLAVIEGGNLPIHLQPVALGPVLAETLALLQPLAASRGVALPAAATGLQPGAVVQADPVRLKQVLLNLLGNAIKYNRPQGTVRVQCDPLSRADEPEGSAGWRITVRDEGPGLDAEQQARLFSAFERLGAETGPVEGTGLGLVLSRGLVRAMGGELGLHSRPGEGSSFWVQLGPAQAPSSAPASV
jgi:PAS domain S-box-containing protein